MGWCEGGEEVKKWLCILIVEFLKIMKGRPKDFIGVVVKVQNNMITSQFNILLVKFEEL